MAKRFLGLNQVVASNLRKLRKELGISQEELAEKCGLHRTYIGAIERSERNITLQTLEKLAGSLGVSPLELLKDNSDVGLPTGSDVRLVISNDTISQITNEITNSCWLFLEIKSVGPRDDQDHAVMSHNQISGSGRWEVLSDGVSNDVITATGIRVSHQFYCSIPPIYILSDGLIVPVVIIILKPVYRMLSLEGNDDGGQPLNRISFASVPNGILLHEQPNYLIDFPNLFFPGKDETKKDPRKRRCRVSFEILRRIDSWRFREIDCSIK